MQSKFRLDRVGFAALRRIVSKKSMFTAAEFKSEIADVAEAKVQRQIAKVHQAEQGKEEDAARYELPKGMNVEQHLFNLAFNSTERPIRIIDHVFCQYDPSLGYWEVIPDEAIELKIMQVAEKAKYPDTKTATGRNLGTAANVEKTVKHAVIKLWHDSRSVNNDHLLSFRNGTVCTKTGKLSRHDPKNFITAGLPYDYQENAECPAAMREFIESSFGADQIEYVRAAIGLILDLTAPDKFVHVIGPSGSGKGTFVDLVTKMFSPSCVSPQRDLTAFGHPDESHKYLTGKRLFTIDDFVGFAGKEIGGFYTGVERKPMSCRTLFAKRSYNHVMNLRAIIASTGPIDTSYSTAHGWKRRTFPLPTVGTPPKTDRTLGTRLEECLGDIVSWVLCQPKDQRNAIIENPEYYNRGAADYFVESACSSSSVWSFVENCLEPLEPHHSDNETTQTVDLTGDIYAGYRAYCLATNKNALSLDKFKGNIKQAIAANYVPRRGSGGCIPDRYVYFRLIPSIFSKSESGLIACNTSNLRSGGIAKFKEWARNYGLLSPFTSESIANWHNAQQQANNPATPDNEQYADTNAAQNPANNQNIDTNKNVHGDTNEGLVQTVQGVQAKNPELLGHFSGYPPTQKNSENIQQNNPALPALSALTQSEIPTVTQGTTTEIAKMQRRMLASGTVAELMAVRESDMAGYESALAAWDSDGQRPIWSKHAHTLR